MKKLSFTNKIIYFINSVFAVLLLLSFFLPYLSPKTFSIVAILSLFVPALIFINIIFCLYWIISLKKQFFISAVVLLVGWFTSSSIYEFSKSENTSPEDITIMSYNVRMFNHWKWLESEDIPSKINEFIQQKSPDILLMQEYYIPDNKIVDYPFKFIQTKNKSDKIGLAIFSKFPIINRGSLEFKNTSNNIIFVDIVRKKDTIRVYNLHLQSLHLKTDKQNFGQENSEKLMTVLKNGFKKQVDQTQLFLAHEKNWLGKKIVAGDFNNTSFSWIYHQISKNKKDAFYEAGKGFGKTFNYWFPMRIDFIFTDENANMHEFFSFSEQYSDHFPILASVNWQE